MAFNHLKRVRVSHGLPLYFNQTGEPQIGTRIDKQVKGTRLLIGDEAKQRRMVLDALREIAEDFDYDEIVLPALDLAEVYSDKAGIEMLNQMYVFNDKSDRQLCLRPEGTATCQLLAQKYQQMRDLKLWYETRCWRYEQPQAGRYREFTQFGVEILNPKQDYFPQLLEMGEKMIKLFTKDYEIISSTKRGLAYYVDGQGFEIICPALGAQKQVLGGGKYSEGIGFAVGVDRLSMAYVLSDNYNGLC